MQLAFEHACGMNTPSADIFVFRANMPYVLGFKKFKKVRSRSGTISVLAKSMPQRSAATNFAASKHVQSF